MPQRIGKPRKGNGCGRAVCTNILRMLNPLIVSTTVLLGLTVFPGIAAAQQPGRQMVPVAKDVYFMTGAGSNASFVVTDEGVLVFDSDIRNNDLPFIRKVTDKKVAYLFASHASGDHSTGAWYFREDKPVYIGTRDQIRAYYQSELKEFEERQAQKAPFYSQAGARLFPPSLGFDDGLTVLFGGLTFQAKAAGSGHTSGDLTDQKLGPRVYPVQIVRRIVGRCGCGTSGSWMKRS